MRVYEFVPDRLQFDMFFSTACLDLLLGVVHLPVLGVQQCGCDTAWFPFSRSLRVTSDDRRIGISPERPIHFECN